jgi:hypothetical protein
MIILHEKQAMSCDKIRSSKFNDNATKTRIYINTKVKTL